MGGIPAGFLCLGFARPVLLFCLCANLWITCAQSCYIWAGPWQALLDVANVTGLLTGYPQWLLVLTAVPAGIYETTHNVTGHTMTNTKYLNINNNSKGVNR